MSENQDAIQAAQEIINRYKENQNASKDLASQLEGITTFPQRLKGLGFTDCTIARPEFDPTNPDPGMQPLARVIIRTVHVLKAGMGDEEFKAMQANQENVKRGAVLFAESFIRYAAERWGGEEGFDMFGAKETDESRDVRLYIYQAKGTPLTFAEIRSGHGEIELTIPREFTGANEKDEEKRIKMIAGLEEYHAERLATQLPLVKK